VPAALSPRLAAIVDPLPLRPGLRVLEIGGAPGAAARVVAEGIGDGHVLVIDRSPRGVALTERAAVAEIAAGRLSVRCVAAEDFALEPGERPYDLAFAVRVGALDGRHPQDGARARRRIRPHWCPAGACSSTGARRCARSGSISKCNPSWRRSGSAGVGVAGGGGGAHGVRPVIQAVVDQLDVPAG